MVMASPGPLYWICFVLYFVFLMVWTGVTIAGMWATFSKAQRPGWAAIVPIYNFIVMADVGHKPWWWIFVPIAGPIIVCIGVADSFGRSAGFGVGLCLLSFVFFPLLGFGDAEYQG